MRTTLFIGAIIGLTMAAGVSARAEPPRLVEAWAETPVDIHAPIWIAPASPAQAGGAVYREIADRLGQVLAARGFNLVSRREEARVYLLVNYVADVKPPGTVGVLGDPVYRALRVTAVDARSVRGPNDPPRVLWQTVVDSGGFSSDLTSTIPILVGFGARYYGRSITPPAGSASGSN